MDQTGVPTELGYSAHPEVASTPPGSDRSRDEHRGHDLPDKHAGHSVEIFQTRFWVALVLTIPTIVWGHMLPAATRWHAPAFPGSAWLPPVLGTLVFVYGGFPFLRGAVGELKLLRPGMMALIALAISVALVFSVAVTLGYPGTPLWEELATLVTVMLLGHWIEMRSINQARGALGELAKLIPRSATRIRGEREEEVPVSELAPGDLVLVRPGAGIPADGLIRAGESTVNEAMITGESRPVRKRPGDRVIAGTVNGSGALQVEITEVGRGTVLAGIMRLVESAQSSRSRAQALADRAAFALTIVALGVGAITAASWLLAGASGAYTIERVVTVLVIACPHALGLAIPLVVAISTTVGARAGLLVRDRRGLEEARRVQVVVFDKTGTLTLGEHRVVASETSGALSNDEALRIAAAVEGSSEHPVGRAIVSSARERGLAAPRASAFQAISGHGVEAEVDGRLWRVGGPNLLRRDGVKRPPSLEAFAGAAAERGEAVVYLVGPNRTEAAFAVTDAVRPEAGEAVRALRSEGVEVVMLTGDARAVANAVASQLGIDRTYPEVLPQRKAEIIQELQRGGRRVAMVGDGVNDAPALLTADVGIAMGAGTDVAVEAGDVVLVRSDPRDVPRILRLSRVTYRKMIQNLLWAAGYNVVAIPLAAGVLAGQGFVLAPAAGAILMSASTVVVAINAQLLRRLRP